MTNFILERYFCTPSVQKIGEQLPFLPNIQTHFNESIIIFIMTRHYYHKNASLYGFFLDNRTQSSHLNGQTSTGIIQK